MSDEKKEFKLSKYAQSRHDLIMSARQLTPEELEQVYLPASLAHVYFPRRDPKLAIDQPYMHTNGHYTLSVSERGLLNRNTGRKDYFGLPFGPKARIILSVINAMALQQGSSKIDLNADSLSTFLKHIGMTDGGNQISQARNQVARLATATISVQYDNGRINPETGQGGATNTDINLISGFDFWKKESPEQLTLWDRNIVLSEDYWQSLQTHALPLSLEHLRILSGNARAIDVYTFLTYRLHAISKTKPVFLTWPLLHEMFGGDIARLDHFKERFRQVVSLVKLAYTNANFELDNRGMTLRNSPAPITGKDKLLIP